MERKRKMTRKFLIVTALVAGVATTAQAQICAGTAPFSAGSMRVGANAEFPENTQVYGGEFAWGHQSGMFLGASLDRATTSGSNDSALRFGGNAGYEIATEAMPKVRFCPVAKLGYSKLPDIGTATNSMIDYALGLGVGGVLPASDNVAIVPSATLAWTGARIKSTDQGVSATASDSWGQARLAAGVVVNRNITLAPTVTIPISHDGDKTRFGFAASYNFGRPSGVMQQGQSRKKTSKR
jgi:hypothetical protein